MLEPLAPLGGFALKYRRWIHQPGVSCIPVVSRSFGARGGLSSGCVGRTPSRNGWSDMKVSLFCTARYMGVAPHDIWPLSGEYYSGDAAVAVDPNHL
jgi:hypothetical protein